MISSEWKHRESSNSIIQSGCPDHCSNYMPHRCILKLRSVYRDLESNMLRAFSLFLLALAASEVFGADEDTGSVVAWSPLVIISHMTDEVGGIGSGFRQNLLEFERFRMIKVLLDQSLYTGSDTTCRIDIP
ncbi:hypothetical protein Tco_1369436 [Tanacetum coccineum]